MLSCQGLPSAASRPRRLLLASRSRRSTRTPREIAFAVAAATPCAGSRGTVDGANARRRGGQGDLAVGVPTASALVQPDGESEELDCVNLS